MKSEEGRDPETEREIRKTLRSILLYVEADTKYADHAQLHSELEWLIKKVRRPTP